MARLVHLPIVVNQLVCFVLIESWLHHGSARRLCWLYSLLSYRVLSNYVVIARVSRRQTKVTRALSVITKLACLAALLSASVIFSRLSQPFNFLAPSLAYFVITDHHYVDLYSERISWLQIHALEGLEDLVCKALCRTLAIIISVILITLSLTSNGNYYTAILAIYTNIYVPYKDMYSTTYQSIRHEALTLIQFRRATAVELHRHEDVCAICLCQMKQSARVTPCRHIFHGRCLRLSLRQRKACPMCNRTFQY